MRNIKFRAWLPEFQLMIDEDFTGGAGLDEGDVVFDCGPSGISVLIMDIVNELRNGEHHQDFEYQIYDDAKLMQYIEQKDKNNVKIFEGDILELMPYGEEADKYITEVTDLEML